MGDTRTGTVGRAFAILGCFDDRHPTLTLSELARRCGLPVNSTLRIARSLVAEGALERRADGRFTIGLRLYELSSLAPRGVGLRQASLPYLQDLHDLTGQHAMLSVREGDEAVLVERVSPKRGTRSVDYRVGGRMPLAATGGGLVLLAFAPDEVQERAITTFDVRTSVDEVTSAVELRRYLSAVRRTGAAVGSQRSPRALVAAGAPIRDASGVVAALSIVMPAGHAEPSTVVPALHACARAITRDATR
ncbi:MULTISPECIES: IclR family transcriptional regulator [unclassified Curtobacterium]|uniref:IclR family transcriptional regulator n=1 Tax=unclassified Curtobacterium TaxID=257496 RepID=UPI001E487082|nr:IclR family transcriptional regulator [Curtobacterium sp. GD1]MCC8908926.1 IclR family transcriptional regulator [Curtobacterium sp. GD1]